MDSVERMNAASRFLLQSPPGEINDVLDGELSHPVVCAMPPAHDPCCACCRRAPADVRNILSNGREDSRSAQDDEEIMHPALRQYNLEQFITADVPESNHQVRRVWVVGVARARKLRNAAVRCIIVNRQRCSEGGGRGRSLS